MDLKFVLKMPDFALARISTHVFHAWTSLQLDGVWTVDYPDLLFRCILARATRVPHAFSVSKSYRSLTRAGFGPHLHLHTCVLRVTLTRVRQYKPISFLFLSLHPCSFMDVPLCFVCSRDP